MRAAEQVVKAPVDGVDAVVGWARGGVRAVRPPGRRLRRRDRGIDAVEDPIRHRGEQRGPTRRHLVGDGDPDGKPRDIGEELHEQRACFGNAAAGDDLGQLDPVLGEVLHDPPVAKRYRLEQRPIDVLAGGMECEATEHAGEVGVGQDRAVAVEPIECDEAGFAGTQLRSRALERGEARAGRSQVAQEPGEHVADRCLPCLIAVAPGQNPVSHDTRYPGETDLLWVDHHVADRGADDRDEDSRAADAGTWDGHERVHVANRYRRRRRDAQTGRQFGADGAGAGPERQEGVAELLVRAREAGIGGLEVLRRWQAGVPRPQRLVARRALLAPLEPGQVPDQPVGRLDEAMSRLVELPVLEP